MMRKPDPKSGFTLIELLLVLAILGILGGVAIPTFVGQRRRARVIGDAQSNAEVLRMQLETTRADTGGYGTAGTTYKWVKGVFDGTASGNPAPAFTGGNTKMDVTLNVGTPAITYTLSVNDPSLNAEVFRTNQNGSVLFKMK